MSYMAAAIIYEMYLRVKTVHLFDRISCKRDLLYMKYSNFERIVAEIFRRDNHSIKFSDRFGEGEKGLIIDGTTYAQLKKDNPGCMINVEQVMKLVYSMQRDNIHRGMYITLGDFENITYRYCHKNVITCINGDRLLEMCLAAQAYRRRPSFLRQ